MRKRGRVIQTTTTTTSSKKKCHRQPKKEKRKKIPRGNEVSVSPGDRRARGIVQRVKRDLILFYYFFLGRLVGAGDNDWTWSTIKPNKKRNQSTKINKFFKRKFGMEIDSGRIWRDVFSPEWRNYLPSRKARRIKWANQSLERYYVYHNLWSSDTTNEGLVVESEKVGIVLVTNSHQTNYCTHIASMPLPQLLSCTYNSHEGITIFLDVYVAIVDYLRFFPRVTLHASVGKTI